MEGTPSFGMLLFLGLLCFGVWGVAALRRERLKSLR
jgi:hypothetical protein